MSYTEVTFSDLSDKRKEAVRETIQQMWSEDRTASEISKKVRISLRSVATALGNLTRQNISKKTSKNRK